MHTLERMRGLLKLALLVAFCYHGRQLFCAGRMLRAGVSVAGVTLATATLASHYSFPAPAPLLSSL